MPRINDIKGVSSLIAKLRQRIKMSKRKDNVAVLVGYTAAYALFVHESVEMKLKGQKRPKPHKGSYWDPKGAQAKFLENPARENRKEYVKIIRTAAKATKSLEKGLLLAGLRLQADSQRLVPVDTGNLKGSAFTRKE